MELHPLKHVDRRCKFCCQSNVPLCIAIISSKIGATSLFFNRQKRNNGSLSRIIWSSLLTPVAWLNHKSDLHYKPGPLLKFSIKPKYILLFCNGFLMPKESTRKHRNLTGVLNASCLQKVKRWQMVILRICL